MKINQMKQIEVDVTEIRLHMKVRDTFNSCLVDAQGDEVAEYEGYVPGFFPGEHYGDYLILNIDLETGQIKNWVKPKPNLPAVTTSPAVSYRSTYIFDKGHTGHQAVTYGLRNSCNHPFCRQTPSGASDSPTMPTIAHQTRQTPWPPA